MDTSVIVVGAGPVGLMLAGELRLGGVDVIVLEQRAVRSGESRGLGFTARTAEVFDQRGLLARFGDVQATPRGHFGGMPMDFSILEGAHFGIRGIPQYRTEQILEDWTIELGAKVLREYRVTDVSQTDDEVLAVVEGPAGRTEYRAEYLVLCDGGRSNMRLVAGFDFPGTPPSREMYLADVVGRKIRPRPIGEKVAGGMVMAAPLEDGVDRIVVCPLGTTPTERTEPPPFEEVADAWQRLTGESLHGAEVRWVSYFTDHTRQCSHYRNGRFLIAGDAAHIHLPAGGQGLSMGVQDAVNLGWKLAATIKGWAPEGLLDTYHSERHPVGARVLRNTQAQGMLYLSGQEVDPLRSVMTELIAIPEVARHLAGMVSGFDIRYDVGVSGHPLLGMRLPNCTLEHCDGSRINLYETLHTGRGVLLSTEGPGELTEIAKGWSDRVDVRLVRGVAPDGPQLPSALLIRPDGYVAWTSSGGGDLTEALNRWFGAAREAEEPST
ncbi:MAG TPA: FAD-dependent monooxygenase [Actinophytocola sp.]|uniref:FAD-dependent monooxygenase n=1 Tax=Actinophytocola sp. TaxID=1872138 RepID=UPI002DDD5FC5|nr:FAD-dependent monooxygenase [Actinophytocola sp.]HEV2780496.1 FAD-dependent monooxygenase [Actinophytocola sp.]